MAGVYTDNQPDFSFLQPGETKTWSQYWYPIREIGPAHRANLEAALSVQFAKGALILGIAVTANQPRAAIVVEAKGKPLARFKQDLSPSGPWINQVKLPGNVAEGDMVVRVQTDAGHELISFDLKPHSKGPPPQVATEAPAPEDIKSNDELFITGLHLYQYRHASRSPVIYWREALRRDPLDSRCNNALGLWHLHRGELAEAEACFRRAIERLTRRNSNPYDGEAFYNLGLCLRYLGRDSDAYAFFYKATWNQAWAGAGYHALAELDCAKRAWSAALEHLDHSLRFDVENLRARNLKTMVLRKLNCPDEADELLRNTLKLDPLDWWAKHFNGEKLHCDLQTKLDLAHDFARAGCFDEAINLLKTEPVRAGDLPDQSMGVLPMVYYTLGWLCWRKGDAKASLGFFRQGEAQSPDYCFPARLEEIFVLAAAMESNPADVRAPYYLGNLFYDRRRYDEAIRLWERSAKRGPAFSIVWRNLGIGYYNFQKKPAKARAAYDRAFRANSSDARLLYERDQLWKRLGIQPAKRLRELEKYRALVGQRDDLSVELCVLYNQTGRYAEAARFIAARRFQPWEGGEGAPLQQHVRAHLGLGRAALAGGDPAAARKFFELALASPRNLGEAKHLLANQSDIHYWLGCALDRLGDRTGAREHWLAAANFKGDFQEMSVCAFSEMTYYSARSMEMLGKCAGAKKIFRALLAYARKLQRLPAKIDYFATSLPAMLLFDDDLQRRQETQALFLQAQARFGLGQTQKAKSLLQQVLRRDPAHPLAADFLKI